MRIEAMSQPITTIGVSQGKSELPKQELIAKSDEKPGGEQQLGKKFVSEKDVIHLIEKANDTLNLRYTNLQFSIHEKTHEIMVKVVDSESGEIIREIPPEKVLDAVAKMWEIAGIILDEKR